MPGFLGGMYRSHCSLVIFVKVALGHSALRQLIKNRPPFPGDRNRALMIPSEVVALVATVDFDLALTLTRLATADKFDNAAWRRVPRLYQIRQARLLARIIAKAGYDRPNLRDIYVAGILGSGRVFTLAFCELFEQWETVMVDFKRRNAANSTQT